MILEILWAIEIDIPIAEYNVLHNKGRLVAGYAFVTIGREVIFCITDQQDIHTALAPAEPKCALRVLVGQAVIAVALLNKGSDRGMVGHLLGEVPEVLGHELVGLPKHWIEGLLLPPSIDGEVSKLVAYRVSQSQKRVVRTCSLCKQFFSVVVVVTELHQGCERLVEYHWQRDTGQVLPEEVFQELEVINALIQRLEERQLSP